MSTKQINDLTIGQIVYSNLHGKKVRVLRKGKHEHFDPYFQDTEVVYYITVQDIRTNEELEEYLYDGDLNPLQEN